MKITLLLASTVAALSPNFAQLKSLLTQPQDAEQPQWDGAEYPQWEGTEEPQWEGAEEPHWEGAEQPQWEEDFSNLFQPKIFKVEKVKCGFGGPLVDEIEEEFGLADANHDGHLTYDEIAGVLAQEEARVPRILLEEVIIQSDQDGNGSLDECEVLGLLHEVETNPEVQQLLGAYSGAIDLCGHHENDKKFQKCVYCQGGAILRAEPETEAVDIQEDVEQCIEFNTVDAEEEDKGCGESICFNGKYKFHGKWVRWLKTTFLGKVDANEDKEIDEHEIKPVIAHLFDGLDQDDFDDDEQRQFLEEFFHAISEQDVDRDGQMTVQEIARALFWATNPWSPFYTEFPAWFTPEWFAGRIHSFDATAWSEVSFDDEKEE